MIPAVRLLLPHQLFTPLPSCPASMFITPHPPLPYTTLLRVLLDESYCCSLGEGGVDFSLLSSALCVVLVFWALRLFGGRVVLVKRNWSWGWVVDSSTDIVSLKKTNFTILLLRWLLSTCNPTIKYPHTRITAGNSWFENLIVFVNMLTVWKFSRKSKYYRIKFFKNQRMINCLRLHFCTCIVYI